jgi:hypothetical protein
MSAPKSLALLVTAIVGFGAGVVIDRRAVATEAPPPPPAASAPVVDCDASARIQRPLFLPRLAPTTGHHPRPPTNPLRASAVESCAGDASCVVFQEGDVESKNEDAALLGVILAASRVIPSTPTATLRIAGGGDGLGVPRFASEAAVTEGDEIPTLAGAVRVVTIQAHDPTTNVAARFVEDRRAPIEPLRFFVGPNIAAFAAGFHLALEWDDGRAHVVGIRSGDRWEANVSVGDALVLGAWRYRVVAAVAPSGAKQGWLEIDARPTRAAP